MNLIQAYAGTCLLKIDKPSILKNFFPLPFEKYITISVRGGMPAKQYHYWSDVLSLIHPKLEENGIKIVQLGDKDEPQMPNCYYLGGKTSINQSAYIVSNALLHLGTDSFLVHVASAFDIPVTALYSISSPRTCGPYFGNKTNQILLEPNFAPGVNYSYNPGENPSPINTIKVEQIVEAVGKLLKIDFPRIKTLSVGTNYINTVLEIVPDSVLPATLLEGAIPTIRFDLGGVDQAIYQQIQIRKSAVFTKTPLNLDILKQLRPHIERIIYQIEKDYSPEFVKALHFSGIPYIVLTELPEEELGLIKLDLCEFCVIHPRPKGSRPEIQITENTRFRTNKFLFSEGKTFLSLAHFKAKSPVSDNSNIGQIIDNDDFWFDASFNFLYELVS